jgi:hypothetical protein
MKLKASVALLAAVVAAGCTPDWARQNDSPFVMRVAEIVGTPGGEGEAGAILHSDICCAIFNDSATVTVELFRKNVNLTSSPIEDVTLTRYEVVYTRTDGHNIEGVDVPYRITGPLSVRMHSPTTIGETTAEVIIDVVRHQAKLEPPLVNLRNNANPQLTAGPQSGGEVIITTIAHITVFGETTNGRSLSASGDLQVTFADFGGEG